MPDEKEPCRLLPCDHCHVVSAISDKNTLVLSHCSVFRCGACGEWTGFDTPEKKFGPHSRCCEEDDYCNLCGEEMSERECKQNPI